MTQKSAIFERFLSAFFKVTTYLIIALAGYIFVNIAYNGSKALFIPEAPFINIDFLTQKPQTLHVYEPKEIYDQISQLKSAILELKTRREAIGSSDAQASREIQNNIKVLKLRFKRLTKNAKQIDCSTATSSIVR